MRDRSNGKAPNAGWHDLLFNRAGSPEGERAWQRLEDLVGNASSMSRQFMRQLSDPRVNIDDECGYPAQGAAVNVETFKQLYDRDAIACRVVQLLPKECWQVTPMVYEDEDSDNITDFEKAWDDLGKSLHCGSGFHREEEGSVVWEYLLRADTLSGIGHFGILLLGLDDGRNLQDPVDGVVKVPDGRPTKNELARLGDMTDPGFRLTFNTGKGGSPETYPLEVLNDWRTTENAGGQARDSHGRWSPEGDVGNCAASGKTHRLATALAQHAESMGYKDPHVELRNGTLSLRAKRSGMDTERHVAHLGLPKEGVRRLKETMETVTRMNEGTENAYVNGPRSAPRDSGSHVNPRTPDSTNGSPGWTDANVPPGGSSALGSSLSGTDQQYFGTHFGPPEEMSDTPAAKGRKLLFLRAFDESLVQIVRYEWNVRSPRFGMPVMYRVTLNDPREQHTGVGLPLATVFVHWSRIVHVADNLGSSEIFGVPRMRPVLNRLLDLQKVYGADGECYWRNAVLKLFFETHPQLGGEVAVDADAFKDSVEQMMNGLQQWMLTKGISAKSIPPALADPTPHVAVQLEAVCIQMGCPVRVFKGSERGELASSQDDASWNDRLRHRQTTYLTPRLIVPFIDRLIMAGVLPAPKEKRKPKPADPKVAPPAAPGGEGGPSAGGGGGVKAPGSTPPKAKTDSPPPPAPPTGNEVWNAFNPTQPRDEHGKFVESGKGEDVLEKSQAAEDFIGMLEDKEESGQSAKHAEDEIGQVLTNADLHSIHLEKGGKITGAVGFSKPQAGVAAIEHMGSLVKGAGTVLVDQLKKDHSRVIARNVVESARGFYEKAGFRHVAGKDMVWDKPTENEGQAWNADADALDGVPQTGDSPDDTDEGGPSSSQERSGADTPTVVDESPMGYSVEWPDLDSLSDTDKATIANTLTTALAAYVAGNVEALVSPHDFLTRILKMDEEEATEIILAVTKAHADQETMTQPPMVQGRPVEAPEGTQEHADQEAAAEAEKAKADQFKQGLDAKTTMADKALKAKGPPSIGGKK